jgi:hypothetical protein
MFIVVILLNGKGGKLNVINVNINVGLSSM